MSADPGELRDLDLIAQAALVRRGEVTAMELVAAAIARIEQVNPEINAVVTPLFDHARDAASGDLPDGPLRGCLLYTSPSPRDATLSRMPSSA